MAFTVLKNVSQDELNWYHETRYWMHVSDEVTRINAAMREGHAKGLTEGRTAGLTEGITKGKHEKAVEASRNLLKMNILSIDQIAQAQGLPLEKVQELAKELAADRK